MILIIIIINFDIPIEVFSTNDPLRSNAMKMCMQKYR